MKKLYFLFVVMALSCIGAVAQSTFYLRGGMNGWLDGGLNAAWQFKNVSGDDYILENVEIAAGVEFKVADGTWGTINYGGVLKMEAGKDYTLTHNSTGNCTLAVNFKGNVKFNLASHVIHFEGESEIPVVDPDAWKNWHVNFKGDFNQWTSNEGVKADANGIATSKTYTAQGAFKVCVHDGIKDVWHSSGSEVPLNEWISIPDNNNNNMTFPASVVGKEVVFKYDVLNDRLMVVYEEPKPTAPETLFVYSTMTGFTPVEMTKTETGFKAEGVVFPKPEMMDDLPYFKFSTVAEPTMNDFYGAEKAFKWIEAGTEYPITEGSSSNWEIAAGTYDITVTVAADASMTFIMEQKEVPVEMITIYWDNAAGWENVTCGIQDENFRELGDPVAMVPVFEAEPVAYSGKVSPANLLAAQIPANTVYVFIAPADYSAYWMNFDTDTGEATAAIADQMVYGETGLLGHISEVLEPEDPEALYLRGNVDLQNNMLTKDGIVYSGTVTVMTAPGEMYGIVRVYTANDDNATNYGGVSETENCVAQSGEIIELSEEGVNISIVPGTYSVKVEWNADIKSIVFTKVEAEGYTIYWDNTTAKWAEPWAYWVTTDLGAAAMTRDVAASPAGYDLWSIKVPVSTTMLQFVDGLDDTGENMSVAIEQIVENGVYGPDGYICTLDELGKTEPAETLLFKWHNAEAAADYVAEAGTIVAYVEEVRLNYSNTALGKAYKTICLSGKKGDDATAHMVVTFTEPLKEGDVISMTAFRNKNATGKGASAHLAFDNGAAITIGGSDGLGFVNLNADGDTPNATEPNTLTYTVTAAEAGATSMKMTCDKSSTNLFITNLTISGKREAPQPGFEVPETLFLLGLSDPIEMTRNGNTFSLENVDVAGWFGACPVMYFQNVADENDENARIFGPKPEETVEGILTCASGVSFGLAEAASREAMTSFTTPYSGIYNFTVTFEEGNIVATVTEVEPEKIVVYWDNTVAQWEKPAAIPDFAYFLYGQGKAPIEMVAVEGKPNLYMAEIPDNLDMVFFMDFSKDPMGENYDPEVSEYTREEAPVANMVYSKDKEPVDISNWSAIVDIEAESGEAVYYDLRGVRVDKPAAGNLYIRVEDGKASKVRF